MINNRSYDISRKDKSFKSFIISLLVFLVILVVILLVLTFYNKSKSDEKNKGSYDSQRGNIKTWTTDSEADSKTSSTKSDNFVENPIKNSHTTTNLVTDPATAFTKTNLGTTKSTDKPDMTTSSFVSDKSTISSGANIHKQNTTIYPTNASDTTLSNFVTDTSVMPSGTISNSQNHLNTTESSTSGFMTVTPLISTGKKFDIKYMSRF
ncbi:dentin sialophosphoprotein-like [Aethina tumida]|uniref:dentin sialophosphoprotein-like n=1 Tax=Aethina tumida TaxID=116153 RepID=UPI0021498449|nr:dentin sialophosphoprotein-like [Aethina tumida]